ncbi:hypothetical protein KBC79_07300, partial [Candidatus Woesebacteria bacterium]|nr:hypothetical protein [Candidatus Woesebacteria bacterium]
MTETTQLFSDPLKLPTKPPTEGVLRANEKTSGETQILDKGLLLLSNIVDFDSLAPNKKELLTAFEKPSVQIWSTFEYENIEDAKKQADIVVFLASGLASTHEQWNMNGLSFIHRLASDVQEIERSSSTKLLGEKTAAQKILYVSVNQPGFGSMQFSAETRKKPKKELVDLVSDENYAEMMSVIYEGMGLSDVEDKLVAVGHSAGGEMICTAALKKKFKNALLFAVNPSVGIDAQSLFDGLRLLTEAGGWMPGSLKNAIQPHVISRVTGSSGPMVTLHNEQATVNVEAFIAKLAQLAEEGRRGLMDSFSDGSQSTDNLLSIVNNLQIIFAEQDVLTPERHITAWYDLAKSTIQKSLGELGITLSIDQNALSPYIKVPKATHDTLFVDTKVQSQYTRPIATAIIERIKVNKLFAQASRVSRAELVDIVPPTVPVEDLPLLVETESAVPLELIDGDFPEAVPDQSPLVYVKPELTRLDANEDVVEPVPQDEVVTTTIPAEVVPEVPDQSPLVYVKPELTRLDANEDVVEPVPQDEVVTTTIPAEEIPEVPELGVELQGPAEILQEQTDVTVVDSTQDEK